MNTSQELQQLLRSDVDDILARGREYDARARSSMMRAAAVQYGHLKQPIDRVKAIWIVQAMLASMEDRRLSDTASSDVAARLAAIVRSNREERDARRTALDSLALLFIKTKQLTESLDATIRLAFLSAAKSRDPYLSEFAAEALSGEGVLARRSPGRTRIGFTHLENYLKKLRARKIVRSAKPSRRSSSHSGSSHRRSTPKNLD